LLFYFIFGRDLQNGFGILFNFSKQKIIVRMLAKCLRMFRVEYENFKSILLEYSSL